MKPHRFCRRRLGLTPITSTLILLGITVFAMLIVIGYSQDIIAHQRDQMGERLVVEKVFFNPSHITLWVRNIGHGEITVTQALVNGTFHDFDPVIMLPSPVYNPSANATEITIPGTYSLGVYRISLFTFRGNELGIVEVEYT
jgi:hypothetical protein